MDGGMQRRELLCLLANRRSELVTDSTLGSGSQRLGSGIPTAAHLNGCKLQPDPTDERLALTSTGVESMHACSEFAL